MYQIIEVIGMPKRLYQKICLIMRLTTVIMIACLMQVSAAGLAQKITLNERNTSIDNVLRSIGKQSGFAVYSDGKTLSKSQKVTVIVNNVSLEEALDQVFKGLAYTYKIEDKTIAIKPKEEKGLLDRIIARFQAIDVTGKIIDENGQPIAAATVKVKETTISTASDGNGIFLLKNISDDAVLQISYLGYQVKEIKASKDIGSIKMELAVGKLEEVTINAGYYKVKEREATGSIARITSKDIENQPVTNVLATMQGRMAGVNVTQTTGVPGGGFNIQIRGRNSIRPEANAPLYIIDGVPYASNPIGYDQTSTIFPDRNTSPLNSIIPDAIESIEVLKDADATAIYGSRGANGVVLITTKKGSEGQTRFNFVGSSGAGTVANFVKLMNTEQYLLVRRKAYANDKITSYPASAYDVNGTWDQSRYTDWQKELLGGTARMNEVQGTITGGSKQTQFLLSGSYNGESTVFPGVFLYQKGGARFSANHQSLDSKFKLMFSVGYTIQNNNQPAADLSEARSLAPNAPALYNSNGELNWENGTWTNPLAALVAKHESNTKDLIANTVASYQILPNLSISSSFGYTDLQHTESRTSPSTMYNPNSGLTSTSSAIILTNTKRSSWIVEPQLNWEKEFLGSKLGALIGGTFQQQNSAGLSQYGSGFSSNSLLYDLTSATTKGVLFSDQTLYRYQAFFGRLNYNLKERYIINLTARRDGSSRFGPGKQYANFGAIGAAWLFSKENFLKNSTWFSFGKLRGSYGVTGSDQIGDYQFLDTYSSPGSNYQNVVGLRPNRLFNPNFAWETNNKLEAALEMGFFADRLFLTGAWYQNRSSNQLVGIPLPGTTGFSQIQANLDATVQNTGLEFTLRSVNFSTKNFNWTSSFNVSFSRNKLVAFPNLNSSTYRNTYRIGQPLNILLRYRYTGLNPATGIYQFADENNDGLISSPDDRQLAVSLNADYFGGFQNQLSFKQWKLDFLFQFVKQKNLRITGIAGLNANLPIRFLDSWQQAGDQGPYQIYTTGTNGAAITANSRFGTSDAAIIDASYIRLKNIALSYNVPLKSQKIQLAIRLQGQNLLTFTSYEEGDPEPGGRNSLPPLRVITGGVQVSF